MAIYKLKDICLKIGSGATPRGGKEAYCNEGISLIRSQNVLDFTFSYDGLAHINDQQAEKLSNVEVKPQDILLNITGDSVARVCTVDPRTLPARVNQHVAIIRPDENRVLSSYILYFLQMIKPYLLQIAAGGATRNALTKSMIENLELEVPDILSQKKIVSILDDIQEKIRDNNEINKNLLQQAIALYEHFLQEAEWPTATILDIAKKVAMGPFGSNIKVSTFVPEGVPIISGNHLRGYFLEEPEFNYITEEHAERLKNSIVFPHDLIFTHAGNIGQVAMIPDGCKYDRYVLSQRQFYLRCDETKVVPEFLLLFFHSASGQHELLSYANQTGVPSIAQPASNLKKIPFKCPPIHEQLMWQEQVHPLLSQYLNNRLENERLSSLRDTLLPKLMSGELDVSDIDL